jgi:hypothetical protein
VVAWSNNWAGSGMLSAVEAFEFVHCLYVGFGRASGFVLMGEFNV